MSKSQLTGLYDGSWKGIMVDDAFSHPAKMSFNLAAWIYEHAVANGWVQAGDTVLDPFGGVAGTAFHAMKHGLRWAGVELEPPFVDLGGKNISAWQKRFGALPHYGSAVLLQGDSRRLREVLKGEAKLVASSPPFTSQDAATGKRGHFIDRYGIRVGSASIGGDYGQSPGQLGSMREGQAPAIAVSSPPYSEIAAGAGGLNHKPAKQAGQQSGRAKGASQSADQHYGKTDGQLSGLPEGKAPSIAVSSPPFEGVTLTKDKKFIAARERDKRNGSRLQGGNDDGYGDNASNLGSQTGDTFWSAAADIVREVFAILKPGGHAIWVCGNFVRRGKIVPFCDQWEQLCINAGFVKVCRHVAMKKSHLGTQRLLDGTDHAMTKTKVSFFRRLAAKKNPQTAIESEEIICVRKPL